MRKILIVAALMLFAAASVRADIINLTSGTGWTVSGLYDTNITTEGEVDTHWTRSIDGGDYENIAFSSASSLFSTDPVEGVNGYRNSDLTAISGTIDYRTSFNITKMIENPKTAVARIGFWVFKTYDVISILVDGAEADFDIESAGSANEGWFKLLLDVNLASQISVNDTKSFDLNFVFDFSKSTKVDAFAFGVVFDTEKSSIESTEIPPETPEPATMLIIGLGIAGLGLARRRK